MFFHKKDPRDIEKAHSPFSLEHGKVGYKWYESSQYGDILLTGRHRNVKRLVHIPRMCSLYLTVVPHPDFAKQFNLHVLYPLACCYDMQVEFYKTDWEGDMGDKINVECAAFKNYGVYATFDGFKHDFKDLADQVAALQREGGYFILNFYSKDDGSYVGDAEYALHLYQRGIHSPIACAGGGKVANIGFSFEDRTWCGWSHRGMCGFKVGSEVKPGDCAYLPKDKDDFLKQCIRFWIDEDYKTNIGARHTPEGVEVTWVYTDKVPNKKLVGQPGSVLSEYPEEYGRGAWKAATLEDAIVMATAYAKSVS